jgi:dienelactone hydrolase
MHHTARGGLALAITSLLLAAGLAGATAAPGDGRVKLPKRPGPAAPAGPAPATGIGGTARYGAGEWVHQDFVYDDEEQADNAADIVEVRVGDDGGDLVVGLVLNTLRATDATIVGLAIGAGTEARAWPGGAGVSSPWTEFVTIAPVAGTATLTDAAGATTALAPPAVDLTRTSIVLRVPGAGGTAGTVALNGGAGLHEAGDPTTWAADPGVVDLFFNTDDVESGGFRSDAQSAAVASGDVSAFGAEVDLAKLAAGHTDGPFVEPGTHNAVFKSRQSLGEGYGDGFPKYNGLYQPYALWLPEGVDPAEPRPLLLVLHSLGQIHNQYDGDVYPQVAGALGAIAVTPLALGEDGWYWDEALVDTLDVWADVRSRYAIDPDRTLSSGYSMGGYGTYRLATIAPDLLTAGISWVGPPTDGIWTGSPTTVDAGLTYHQLENTNHVPFFIVHGTNDELVPVAGVTRQAERFKELGHEYRYDLHPGQDHFTFAVIDDWTREAHWVQGRSRVTAPARVTFVARPATWAGRDTGVSAERRDAVLGHLRDLLAQLGGSAPDAAYWVRDVAVAGHDPVAWNDVAGTVDLTSHAIAARVPVTNEVAGAGVFGSSPHLTTGLDRFFTATSVANAVSGSLVGVDALTIDLRRAGLRLDGLDLSGVTADREVTVRLVDGRRSATVVVPAAGA